MNRQQASVTPLVPFAPEVGIVKRIRTAFVLGETMAIVFKENVCRIEHFPIVNKMPTARQIILDIFFQEKKQKS